MEIKFMTQLTGYIQRRSGTITPDQQREALIEYGVLEHKDPKMSPIYDDLDEALHPLSIREGDQLVVWGLEVIGLANINKAFVGVGAVGGKGIYDLKNKVFYPCDKRADQKHEKARASIVAFNSRVKSKNGKDKGGKPLSGVWANSKEIVALEKAEMHVDDIAAKFKTSKSTINRILREAGVK